MGFEDTTHSKDEATEEASGEQTSATFNNQQEEKFIKRHGVMPYLAAIALGATVLSPEKPIWAAEVEKGMTWEQGFEALKDDVFTSETEQAAFAVILKDGSVRWVGSNQGESGRVEIRVPDVLKMVQPEIDNKSIANLCSFHTHPVLPLEEKKKNLLVSIDETQAREAVANRKTTISFPPSVTDINFLNLARTELISAVEDAGGRVVDIVFDPSRVWKYRIATSQDYQRLPDYWETLKNDSRNFRQWKEHVNSVLNALSEEALNALEKLLSKTDRRNIAFYKRYQEGKERAAEELFGFERQTIYRALLSTSDQAPDLSEKFFENDKVGAELHARMGVIKKGLVERGEEWNDVVYNQWVPTSVYEDPSPKLYDALRDAYLRNGTVLESFTYEEAKRNPQALCGER